MAGSMRQRGDDSWQLRVHAGRDPATGRKRYVERTFRGNKRDASKALAAMVAEVMPGMIMLKAGVLDDPSVVKPVMQIYCDSAMPWVSLGAEMKSFPKMPG